MAKLSKSAVDASLRYRIFDDLMTRNPDYTYTKVNDRQYGTILVGDDGVEHYCRVGVIIAELRDDMTPEQQMAAEIADYTEKQLKKADKERQRAEKAAADAAKRAAKAAEKGEEEEE